MKAHLPLAAAAAFSLLLSQSARADAGQWKLGVYAKVMCEGGRVKDVAPSDDGLSVAIFNADPNAWGGGVDFPVERVGFLAQGGKLEFRSGGEVYLSAPGSAAPVKLGILPTDPDLNYGKNILNTVGTFCRSFPNDASGRWNGPYLVAEEKDLGLNMTLAKRECISQGSWLFDRSYRLWLSYRGVLGNGQSAVSLDFVADPFSTESKSECREHKVPWAG